MSSTEERLKLLELAVRQMQDQVVGLKLFRVPQDLLLPPIPDPDALKAPDEDWYKRQWPDVELNMRSVTLLPHASGVEFIYDSRKIPLIGEQITCPQFIAQDLMRRGLVEKDSSYRRPVQKEIPDLRTAKEIGRLQRGGREKPPTKPEEPEDEGAIYTVRGPGKVAGE